MLWVAPQIKVGRTEPGSTYAAQFDQVCCGLDREGVPAAMMLTWRLWNNDLAAGFSVVDLGVVV